MTRTATFSTEVMLRSQSLWGKCTVRSVRLHTHNACKQVMIPLKLASMLSNRIELLNFCLKKYAGLVMKPLEQKDSKKWVVGPYSSVH